MNDRVTVCVLLYGDYAGLAYRCINSICLAMPDISIDNLIVGVNDVGEHTRSYLNKLVENRWLRANNIVDAGENVHKYPLMRRVFYETNLITTPYVMWFDDDSFIRDTMQGAAPDFATRVINCMERDDAPAVIGGVYTMDLRNRQIDFIKAQPWYTGRSITKRMRFVTGGWWTARLDFLKSHNYPFPELDHRGGDVMLGALCEQQGAKFATFRDGVAINADDHGNESKAPKRGFDQPPVGADFTPAVVGAADTATTAPGVKRRLIDNLDL